MNDNPLVSVIIPVYNGQEFIRDAVQSALLQTYPNLEVIVVDDGSTDSTRAIVEALAAADARVELISQANGGVARARNRGISAARGEFIAPLDADDMWAPEKIQRQVARMAEYGTETGLVYCWWVWIDVDGTVLDRSPGWRVEGHALETLIQVNFTGNASVPLFRRACLVQAGGYDEKLAARDAGGCEDWDVVLRIARLSKVAVVPDILAGYRRRPGSMSTSCNAMWRSQELVLAALRELSPQLRPALFRRSARQFALYLAGLSFRSGEYAKAIRWGLRALPSRLPFLVSGFILKVVVQHLRSLPTLEAQVMIPGKSLNNNRIPGPLIPYDHFY